MRLISQKHPQWKTLDNDTTNYLNWQCDGNIYWTCDAELTRSIISSQPTIRLFNSRGVARPARDSTQRTFKCFITMVPEAKQQGAPCRSFFFSFFFLAHQGTLSSAHGAGGGLISKTSTRTQQQLEEVRSSLGDRMYPQ